MTGDVGVGTETPTEKLDVNGNLSVSGKTTIGSGNTNTTTYGLVAGTNNIADAEGACVLGGQFNNARGNYSVVAGGGGPDEYDSNSASGINSCVGGGKRNSASGEASTVSGGYLNNANMDFSIVGGGHENIANADHSTVGGGYLNWARASYSTVGGGYENYAYSFWSTVGGGLQNYATGDYSTIPGGEGNSAIGHYSFAAGFESAAGGEHSFALGNNATATHNGSFVWNDDDGSSASSSGDNQFKIAADGGVRFELNGGRYIVFRETISNLIYVQGGANLTASGVWTDAPKRDQMENFTEIDRAELLDKIAALPISRWNHKGEGEVTHISPFAEDFHAAFAVGGDEGIAAMDQAGIALAAIQELNRKNTVLESEVSELKALVKQLLEER